MLRLGGQGNCLRSEARIATKRSLRGGEFSSGTCQGCDALQTGPLDDRFELQGDAATPVWMRVYRAGKVCLLALADDIFKLHQHQASARTREIGQDRVAQLRRVGWITAIGKKSANALRCDQPLADECVEQQATVAAALFLVGVGCMRIGIETKMPAPREIIALPEAPERSQVMSGRRGCGK